MKDPEMNEDTAKIVDEGQKDKIQVSLIINNRAGGNAPLIAEKISERLHKEKQEGLFGSHFHGRLQQKSRHKIPDLCPDLLTFP
jgi:hypothetical protein